MKALITGSEGFIGQHVKVMCRQRGFDFVRFDSSLNQDVRSLDDLLEAAGGCTHVIHLAGRLGTSELFDSAHEAIDVNVHGTLNVLQACEKLGLGYVGITMPYVWDNVYQATKKSAADFAAAWRRHRGVPVSHVRAFNAYGVGQKVKPIQKIIPTFATRAWRGEDLPIWGDGLQLVDMVWAGDIAECLVRALPFGNGEIFDAGTGRGMRVREVAEWVLAITDSDSEVVCLPMRSGEHPANVVAKGEGWETMGWKPEFRVEEFGRAVRSYRG